MKLISCRLTDIRDIFLLINSVKDKQWIINEISQRYDLKNRLSKALTRINSKQFKDELQGVFGMVDNNVFERNKKLISDLERIGIAEEIAKKSKLTQADADKISDLVKKGIAKNHGIKD